MIYRRSVVTACGLLLATLCFTASAQPPPLPAPAAHSDAAETHAVPTLPGQDAYGAIQEVVRILEADPATDWSKVRLDALREHLIDMNEVTLHASAQERAIPGGLEVLVTGAGRALDAIRRMVPSQARQMDGQRGWRCAAVTVPEGVRLTVTSTDTAQIAHIRGLGFIGFMASGDHHQRHHLMLARGLHPH